MQRKASAVWQGDLKGGKGSISTSSGVLKETQYSFSTRFEDGIGTNPEELLAAAHAGCLWQRPSQRPWPVGAKCDSPDNISLLRNSVASAVFETAFPKGY